MKQRLLVLITLLALIATMLGQTPAAADEGDDDGRHVKVMIITMFEFAGPFAGETQRWIEGFGMNKEIPVPGLGAAFPSVFCNNDQVCAMTTDIGNANAASSVMAVLASGKFNFKDAYFLIAGIAGVDPADGTLGSVAWARYAIDGDLRHEIDAREMPAGWPTGYTGFGPVPPGQKPTRVIGNEIFQLNAALAQRAYDLSHSVVLTDNPTAQAYRALYPNAPANQPPQVIMCDSFTDDTYWHGKLLSDGANAWAALLTDGAANYCMTQEEDNATLTALKRGAAAGWLDFNRVAVARSSSNFDQQHPGQTAYESLTTRSGGFIPGLQNVYLVGSVLVREIVTNWKDWRNGVPAAAPLTVKPKN